MNFKSNILQVNSNIWISIQWITRLQGHLQFKITTCFYFKKFSRYKLNNDSIQTLHHNKQGEG
jgi:hypothetical protein